MARRRDPRIESLVRSALADLLETEVNDPRVAFVTITEVDVTPDHDVATIYYTTLDPALVTGSPRMPGPSLPQPETVAEGLASATPRLRSLLIERVRLRTAPQLRFKPDPVADQSARIDRVLRELQGDD
ncbi:MAG: 30S ribosome-binding factor RbfA [Nitriliruptoraceae bacterium]